MYQEPYLGEEAYQARINTGMEFELTYWSRRFGISKTELRELITQVGERAADVRQALQGEQRIAA